MRPGLKYVVVLCGLLFVLLAKAQVVNNARVKYISTAKDTVALDTLSAIPGTLTMLLPAGDTVKANLYTFDYINGRIVWNRKELVKAGIAGDSIKATFRVFPYKFNQPYAHKKIEKALPVNKGIPNPFQITGDKNREDIFKFDGLNKSGAISRGISFGNNQDVVVNSNLNLQLSGKLNDEIEVTAAITDDNIPIQPDGNTQQLQDFDRVYIQLNNRTTKLIAGDFQINRPENTYFMNFNKRLKGGSFSTRFTVLENPDTTKRIINKLNASVAIARGRFARNQIQGIEGNQGPYRLRGNNNETFIIILSGSEKVYVDGRLLKRGQENDYVIDYNTAEVTFTSRIMITKDIRVFVEFEYADNNYSRTLYYFGDAIETKNAKLRFNFYSEQDLKNQPLQQTLDNFQRNVLAEAGDSLQLAVTPNVDTVVYTNNQVLYRAIDTLVNAVPTVKYIYSTDSLLAKYRVGFSFVGANQGNYVLINSLANGKVYQWVDPINGVRQGNYEPIIQLVPPKIRQMYTLGGDFIIGRNLKTGFEVAYSVNNINTFSKKDKENDGDFAIKYYLQHTAKLQRKQTEDPWLLNTTVGYEQVNKNFTALERFRNVEFDRDWNLRVITTPQAQYLPSLTLSVLNKRNGNASYRITSFISGDEYRAYQNAVNTDFNFKGTKVWFVGSQTASQGLKENTSFIRHKSNIAQTIKNKIVIGYRDEQEQNLVRDAADDSLSILSYKFFDYQFYVNNADTTNWKAGTFYRRRTDWLQRNNSLQKSSIADWAGITFEMMNMKNSSLRVITTFRSLRIVDTTLTAQEPDNSLVNRIEYTLRILKGAITTTTFYEVGSGLEQKRQFSYVQVATGQGVYAWVDYNNNNVKELNEFEISPFPDQANYIRIFTPTNDYVKTYSNQFNQVLNINMDKAIKVKKGFRKFLSKFSNQTAYRIERKSTDNSLLNALNPFLNAVNSAELVSLNSSARNTFYFNRNDAVYSIDLNWQDVRNKTLMVNGYDSRVNNFLALRGRYNATKKITLNVELKKGKRSSSSQFLTNRNYQINFYQIIPNFVFQPNAAFRVTLSYDLADKRNLPQLGGQKSINHNAGIDLKYNQLNKGSLQLKFNYINISFNDQPNTPLAYEMLEGLRAGQNMTWNLSYQRNLSQNLQMTITYDGRRPQGVKTVHTGGMQIRALF